MSIYCDILWLYESCWWFQQCWYTRNVLHIRMKKYVPWWPQAGKQQDRNHQPNMKHASVGQNRHLDQTYGAPIIHESMVRSEFSLCYNLHNTAMGQNPFNTLPGWWYTYPPEKYKSQIGSSSQLLGKIKFMFQITNQLYVHIYIYIHLVGGIPSPLTNIGQWEGWTPIYYGT